MNIRHWIPFYRVKYIGNTHITNNRWVYALWLYQEIVLIELIICISMILISII